MTAEDVREGLLSVGKLCKNTDPATNMICTSAALFIENEQSRIYKLQSEVVRLTIENEAFKRRGREFAKHKGKHYVYVGARDSGKSIAMLKNFDNLFSEQLKNFAMFLIDKSENGIISISDLPDFIREWVMYSDR